MDDVLKKLATQSSNLQKERKEIDNQMTKLLLERKKGKITPTQNLDQLADEVFVAEGYVLRVWYWASIKKEGELMCDFSIEEINHF